MRRTPAKLNEQIIIGQPTVSVKVTESRKERVCLGVVPPTSMHESDTSASKTDDQQAG